MIKEIRYADVSTVSVTLQTKFNSLEPDHSFARDLIGEGRSLEISGAIFLFRM